MSLVIAREPLRRKGDTKLLWVNGGSRIEDCRFADLPRLLAPGDVLVLNDAATLPARLLGEAAGRPIELRLAQPLEAPPDGAPFAPAQSWLAAAFGPGSWRMPTEARASAPPLHAGDRLRFGKLEAIVTASAPSFGPRFVRVRFALSGPALLSAIYREGKYVQYSYLKREVAPWDVQTPFAGPAVALEAPSASFAFTWEILNALARAGVRVTTLTHAAGLSSVGTDQDDAALPLEERYWISEVTAQTVNTALRERHRIVAGGTTVARALESAWDTRAGRVRAGTRTTELKLGPASRRNVVSGLLTGLHERGTSHRELLAAFLPEASLARAYTLAERIGYLAHEFGDLSLILSGPPAT